MRSIFSFLLFVLALSFGTTLNARPDFTEYNVQRLTPDHGLSQGSNYFRYEDSRGYMWITANDAVNRYDGIMVKVYNLARYFKDCPPLQQGYGFAEDSGSNVYIGSMRGLYIYHRNTDKFTLKKIFSASGDDLAMPFAYSDGCVWCFNKQYEIAAYRIADGSVRILSKIPLPPIPSIHIYDLPGVGLYDLWPFCDGYGRMWFAGRDQIYTWDSKTGKIQEIRIGKKDVFTCCYYDRANHEMLLGTENGLLIHNIDSAGTRRITHAGNVYLKRCYSVCSNKESIILSCSEGLLLRDKYRDHSQWLIPKWKRFNHIYNLGSDKAGRLWLCDDGFGQIIYDFIPLLLPRLPSENDTSSLLKEKGVMQFSELPNGDIFAHRGILLDYRSKHLKYFPLPVDLIRATMLITETDPYREGIWILYALDKKLKFCFLGKDNILKQEYASSGQDSLGICQNLKILGDRRILAAFSAGLFWLQDNQLLRIPGQPYSNPFVINPLSGNRYAVSYLNNDMWLTYAAPNQALQFTRKILPGVQSYYLAEDTLRHYFWAGTNKGVYLLDQDFNILKLFDANNGLAGTYIYGLLLDDEGNAWCSHQRGLSSIDARNFRIINYDKKDGIQDWDFNNRSFYKSKDGTLYFGGVSGFNYFKPPLEPVSFYQPEIYVDEILVNNKIWLPDTGANQLQHLQLNHRQNNIAVKAVVKDLVYGEVRQLIYRIRETDSTWKQLPGRSIIAFNNLAPGDYTLDLGTFDKYGNQALWQKTILISIAAPYYLKHWFWALVSVLCSVLMFWIYLRIKRNRQKAAQRQLLALEQQRNKITADLHDDIGASLSSLQINSEVANRLLEHEPARARKVLEKIASQSRELSGKIGDMIWSMKPGKEEFMTLSSRIRTFAHDMMADTPVLYQVNIDPEVDIQVTDTSIRRNLVLIVKEAINNTIKYSAASGMDISMIMEQHKLLLTIADNGKGFEHTEATTGNGLANMKKRAAEIDGRLQIRSAPGKGTTITLEVPARQLPHPSKRISINA